MHIEMINSEPTVNIKAPHIESKPAQKTAETKPQDTQSSAAEEQPMPKKKGGFVSGCVNFFYNCWLGISRFFKKIFGIKEKDISKDAKTDYEDDAFDESLLAEIQKSHTSTNPRENLDHFLSLPMGEQEKKNLRFIYTTLANENIGGLYSCEKELESRGENVKKVHPLRTLGYIFTDDQLISAMEKFYNDNTKGIPRGIFIKKLTKNFERNADDLNDYILGFAQHVDIKLTRLLPYFQDKNWAGLVKYLLEVKTGKKNAPGEPLPTPKADDLSPEKLDLSEIDLFSENLINPEQREALVHFDALVKRIAKTNPLQLGVQKSEIQKIWKKLNDCTFDPLFLLVRLHDNDHKNLYLKEMNGVKRPFFHDDLISILDQKHIVTPDIFGDIDQNEAYNNYLDAFCAKFDLNETDAERIKKQIEGNKWKAVINFLAKR